jgi:hypothetical protein
MWPPLPQLLTEELNRLPSAQVVHCYNGKVWLRKGCQWTTNKEMSWSQIGRIIRITGYYRKQIFKQGSICIIKVLNLSEVNIASPTILFQRYFKGSKPAFQSSTVGWSGRNKIVSWLHCHAHALKTLQLEECFQLPICCYKVTVIVTVEVIY